MQKNAAIIVKVWYITNMEILEIEEILKGTQYESFIGTFKKVVLRDFVYPTLFKIGSEDLGYFTLKIRDKKETNFKDSIDCVKIANDVENFVNVNTGVIENDNYVMAEIGRAHV